MVACARLLLHQLPSIGKYSPSQIRFYIARKNLPPITLYISRLRNAINIFEITEIHRNYWLEKVIAKIPPVLSIKYPFR